MKNRKIPRMRLERTLKWDIPTKTKESQEVEKYWSIKVKYFKGNKKVFKIGGVFEWLLQNNV
jgi:hypothetical protein